MNIDTKTRNRIIAVSLLVGSFVIALTFYLADPPAKVPRTLFFPGAITRTLTGEVRPVPRAGTMREDVKMLVEELILGPVSIESTRALPGDVDVNLVALRDGVAFVDLSEEMILTEEDLNLTFDERIETLKASILFNFRKLSAVEVTVGGQALYAPHYNLAESSN